MMKLSLMALLCALALPVSAQRRSVMEGLNASSNAIYISTVAGSVYVRTAGTMTVQGNAFSVGTSSFVVAGGSATVAYLMTARAFSGDGSALTGLAAGAVAQSTITYNLTGSTTETTNFKLCYATGTLTTGGSAPIAVFYSGDVVSNNVSGSYCYLNFLQDGAFISPASSTVGMGKATNSAVNGSGNGAMVRIFPAPSAGSHSWCISLISPFGGACQFATSQTGNQFGVIELR